LNMCPSRCSTKKSAHDLVHLFGCTHTYASWKHTDAGTKVKMTYQCTCREVLRELYLRPEKREDICAEAVLT
jgi:hypothetical protein